MHAPIWAWLQDDYKLVVLVRTHGSTLSSIDLGNVLSIVGAASGLELEIGPTSDEPTSPPDGQWIDTAVQVVFAAAAGALTKELISAAVKSVQSAFQRWREDDEDWRDPANYL